MRRGKSKKHFFSFSQNTLLKKYRKWGMIKVPKILKKNRYNRVIGGVAMVSVQALANTVLKKAFEEKRPVTPMKLQKLIYFIYADYLQTMDEPLLSERFEVWQYGPVLSSIYYEFQSFGANPITKFAKDANNVVYVVSSDCTDILASVNKVWEKYKFFSGIDLSKKTHLPEGAWYKAFQRHDSYLDNEDIKSEQI